MVYEPELTCSFGLRELIPQLILFTLTFLMFVLMALPEFTRRAAAKKRAEEIRASRSQVETGNLASAKEESSILSSGHSETSLRHEEDPSTFGTSTDASLANEVTEDSHFSTSAVEDPSGVSGVEDPSVVSAVEDPSGVSRPDRSSQVL